MWLLVRLIKLTMVKNQSLINGVRHHLARPYVFPLYKDGFRRASYLTQFCFIFSSSSLILFYTDIASFIGTERKRERKCCASKQQQWRFLLDG